MHIIESRGGCLPNGENLLFLKACLGQLQETLSAWIEWRKRHTLDAIDGALFRMLPLLYYKLQLTDYKDADLQKLKGIYRHCWYSNQLLFDTIEKLLEKFHSCHIPTILLKGIALSQNYYPTPYTRPMADGDVLIPLKYVDEAISMLLDMGWCIRPPSNACLYSSAILPLKRDYKQTMHGCTFINDEGYEFDLHWYLFPELCGGDSDLFWRRAVPCIFRSQTTLTLSPTDHLLHTCMHGYKWNILHPMRWIVDAHMIIQEAGNEIEWDFILAQAKKGKYSLRLLKSLEFLHDKCEIPIPDRVLASLREMQFSSFERYEHAVVTREREVIADPKRTVWWHFQRIWCTHRRRHSNQPLLVQWISYPLTLTDELHLQSTWQLPILLCKIALKKIKLALAKSG